MQLLFILATLLSLSPPCTKPPILQLSVPASGTTGQPVAVTGSVQRATGQAGCAVASWALMYGDGDGLSGNTQVTLNDTHTYTQTGTYVVELSAQNASGTPAVPLNLRIAIGDAPPPPPPSTGRGPQVDIVCPAGAVAVAPGASIQAAVSAAPGATTFCIKVGVHRQQRVNPKTGNTFVGEFGAVLDGENVTAHAFEATSTLPQNVTVRNLEIKNYASPAQAGAFQGDNGLNWVVENNAIHDNAVIGIRSGRGWVVRKNLVYLNGKVGISGYAAHNLIIEDNEVYQNYPSQAPETPATAEAAGIKVLVSLDVTFRGNFVHHNYAKGIWIDGGNPTSLVENNTVADNSQAGIWAEGAYGAIIRFNIVDRNGHATNSLLTGAGILVTNARDVEIHGNTVRDNKNGIGAIQSAAPYTRVAAYGVLEVVNLNVHDNIVQMAVGRTGLVQIVNSNVYFTGKNNRFVANNYTLGPNATYFAWNDADLTEAQWQAAGQDTTGSFTR